MAEVKCQGKCLCGLVSKTHCFDVTDFSSSPCGLGTVRKSFWTHAHGTFQTRLLLLIFLSLHSLGGFEFRGNILGTPSVMISTFQLLLEIYYCSFYDRC
jgi:hypothetical protein